MTKTLLLTSKDVRDLRNLLKHVNHVHDWNTDDYTYAYIRRGKFKVYINYDWWVAIGVKYDWRHIRDTICWAWDEASEFNRMLTFLQDVYSMF